MSINLYGLATTQVDNTSFDKFSSRNGQVPAQQPATEDTTTFTSTSAGVQQLTKAAIQTFPSRESRIESLRQAVSAAQYQLDTDKIAASLVSAEF